MVDGRKRLPLIRTRLRTEDLKRFDQICRIEGKTQAEIARRALLFYLDAYEREEVDSRESKLEARLRKMEDRLASMIMRTTIDVGVIYRAIYFNYGKEAEKAFAAFYNLALERLQAKRKDPGDKAAVQKLVDSMYRKDEPKPADEDKPRNLNELKNYKTDA